MRIIQRKQTFATIIRVDGNDVKLFPGLNQLSDAEFSAIEKTKVFKEEIKLGLMSIGKEIQSSTSNAVEKNTLKDRAGELVKEVASVKVKEAIELIKGIGDANVLKQLKESDGRTGVQNAVDDRINDIQNQVGSDLTPESREAPEGDGSDFMDKVGADKGAQSGREAHTAIPAIKKDK